MGMMLRKLEYALITIIVVAGLAGAIWAVVDALFGG
jgi:hypothetical protein